MDLTKSFHFELLKTRGSSVLYMAFIIAGLIPILWFLMMMTNPDIKAFLGENPWGKFIITCGQLRNFLFLPIYLILLYAILLQMEYKNNAWKQVFATPQRYLNIFLSKFLVIQVILILFLLAYNFFVFSFAFLFDLFHPDELFVFNKINWAAIIYREFYTYLTFLGVGALHLWLSFRFKSFLIPILVGIIMHIGAQLMFYQFDITAMEYNPYMLPVLIFTKDYSSNSDLYSIVSFGYMVFFLFIGFFEFRSGRLIR